MGVLTRIWVIAGAAAGWFALALQLVLLMRHPDLSSALGAWRFVSYFTILTNILVAFLFTRAAFDPPLTREHPRIRTAAAAYITVVGAIYVSVLEPLWEPQGWQLVADTILHKAIPVGFVLYWLFAVPKKSLRWADSLIWLIYPVAYLVYALGRAALDGFYPYFFLDISTLGLERVLLNALGVTAVFLIVCAAYIGLGRVLPEPRPPTD